MTNEQAIKLLQHCGAEAHCRHFIATDNCDGCNMMTALNMAIEALTDKRHKTITDAVAQAYEEGQHKASELYEQIIEKQESERLKLCEEIKCLEKKIKQMERKDLPYDAMGDYSHRPQKNVHTIGEIRLFDDNDRKYRE